MNQSGKNAPIRASHPMASGNPDWPWKLRETPRDGLSLFMDNWDGWSLPPPPCPPQKVRKLDLRRLRYFSNFALLREFRNVERLRLHDLGCLRNLNFLRSMRRLRHLHISAQFHAVDYGGIRDLPCLEHLEIFSLEGPRDLTFLRGCDALRSLTIAGAEIEGSALEFLHHNLPALKRFEACGFHNIPDPESFKALARTRPETIIHLEESSDFC